MNEQYKQFGYHCQPKLASDFYHDDSNVSQSERARIDFEVELIGKLIEAREAKGLTHS